MSKYLGQAERLRPHLLYLVGSQAAAHGVLALPAGLRW